MALDGTKKSGYACDSNGVAKFSQSKKIIYYKLNSPYNEDYTKNCGLVGSEIDQNFFNLKEMDIIGANWDTVSKEIILTRVDGEEIRVKGMYETFESKFKEFDFSYNPNSGILTIVTPEDKFELKGFFTDDKMALASDDTLLGDGCMSNPLGIASVAKTGTYRPVNALVEEVEGESINVTLNKLKPESGDRFITKEKVGKFGKLYEYRGVERLMSDLKNNSSEWRVPSKTDWDVMLTCVEGCLCKGENGQGHDTMYSNVDCGKAAGQKLRTKDFWQENVVDGEYEYSTEGTDVNGFSVLPVGYGDEHSNPSKGYGRYTSFWTSTKEDQQYDMYTKRFNYDKNTVYQASSEPSERLSLRLVKTFNGKNFVESEVINGMTFPCVLIPVPSELKDETIYSADSEKNTELYATVWTQINVGFTNPDYLPKTKINDTDWDGKDDFSVRYFVNDWNGSEWVKHELKEGESLVIRGEHEGVSMHEWRLVDGVLVDTVSSIKEELNEAFEERFKDIEASIAEESALSNERDAQLASAIQAEQERAIQAESNLNAKVDAEAERALAAELALDEKIDAETERALAAESALDEKIDTETERALAAELALDGKINTETERALAAELALDAKIDAETERALAAESALDAKIDAETERALAAESALDEKIDAETERALAAESALDEKIDTEIKRLEDTVAGFGEKIDAEIERALAAESALDEKIDTETERALAAEDKLQSELNRTQIGAGLSEDGSYVKNISFEDRTIHYIADAESLNDADVKLDVALQALDSIVNQEIVRTNELRSDLTIEIERAKGVESGLRTDVDSANSKIDTFLLAADLTQDAIDTLREIQSYIDEHGEEAARMVADIAANKEAIEKEVERAKETEGEINNTINTLAKDIDNRIDAIDVLNEGLRRDLNSEISRAKGIEDSLSSRIDGESTRAQNAETSLGGRIDSETARAESTEAALGSRIDTEIARAESAESELNTKVFEISNGLAALKGVANNLRTDLDSEAAKVENINTTVNTLNGQVISLQERTGVLEGKADELYVELDKTNANISVNAENIANEVTARVSADTELRNSIDNLTNNKVEKEDGKGLSTNDFTDILLEKVNNIETNAQVNKIEKIYVDDILMDITDAKEVKLTMPEVPVKGVNVDDNILSLNGTEISANISFDYNSESKQLILYGKDATKVISTVDVKEFVKDGMIESVEVLTLDNGKTVIRITWNTDGNKSITDVPADSLIDIYEAGDGIQEIDNVFSIKLANVAENFLKVDANGLYTEGIKDYVSDEITKTKNSVDNDIKNLSDVISDVQSGVEGIGTNVNNLTNSITEINADLGYAEDNIESLRGDIKSLQDRDVEIETLINNAFVPESGEGVNIVITSGTETDRSKKISGNIKGYYTGAIKPESESNSDFSLLRMTETGHLYATNATSAMKHTDVDGNIHFLSTYINVLNETVKQNTAEIAVLKDELATAKQDIKNLQETLAGLISGNNAEFMTMLRNSLINDTTFVGDKTDPTVEVVVTKGEKVLIKTREDAVYAGSILD